MNFEHLILDVKEGIAVLTFNRPKSLNALNSHLLDELLEALKGLGQREDVRVLLLTGAGEKAFVAGADITEIAQLNSIQAKLFSKKGHDAIGLLQELPFPVIAAVNGFALGGGSEIALACDFIYASENAKFGLPEINLGLIPGFGGTQRLPRLIGQNLAKEMIFTGKMITAQEAKTIGLVNQVVKPELLMEEVMKTAAIIAGKGRFALREAKQAVNNGLAVDLKTGCELEVNAFALCLASEDAKEGTSAFIEKRKAEFKGKLNS
jgi:enoyl-CoA hydratase